MKTSMRNAALLATVFLPSASIIAQNPMWNPIKAKPPTTLQRADREDPFAVLNRVANMVGDNEAQRLVRKYGLNLINLTWEDTGRYKGSSVGPNISDMTIQVAHGEGRDQRIAAMPVIRHPNFSDLTGDMDPSQFTLLVGNEKGRRLQRVSLREFLQHPTLFLSNPNSWKSPVKSLWAPRDEDVLVSAQACFLPIPKEGKATFNPVLFNYQSVAGDPAVLTILATRQGTSVTIIDNKRDAFSSGSVWGQRLFFNKNGQRASLTGERESDFRPTGGGGVRPGQEEPAFTGMNMVLMIQVPLKQKRPARMYAAEMPASAGFGGGGAEMKRKSDTENAVIGHGRVEGPFTEIDNLSIERDPRFPVRVTVQFYKATSTGVVSEQDVQSIKHDLDQVYAHASNVGSLVTGGHTGRPTEYWGSKVQPRDWWERFWRDYEANTGTRRTVAIAKLRQLLGNNYMVRPVTDLYLRDLLR